MTGDREIAQQYQILFSSHPLLPSPPTPLPRERGAAFKGMFFILGWFWSRGSRESRGKKAIVFVVYPSFAEPIFKNIHL
jgi:hypothetical protein